MPKSIRKRRRKSAKSAPESTRVTVHSPASRPATHTGGSKGEETLAFELVGDNFPARVSQFLSKGTHIAGIGIHLLLLTLSVLPKFLSDFSASKNAVNILGALFQAFSGALNMYTTYLLDKDLTDRVDDIPKEMALFKGEMRSRLEKLSKAAKIIYGTFSGLAILSALLSVCEAVSESETMALVFKYQFLSNSIFLGLSSLILTESYSYNNDRLQSLGFYSITEKRSVISRQLTPLMLKLHHGKGQLEIFNKSRPDLSEEEAGTLNEVTLVIKKCSGIYRAFISNTNREKYPVLLSKVNSEIIKANKTFKEIMQRDQTAMRADLEKSLVKLHQTLEQWKLPDISYPTKRVSSTGDFSDWKIRKIKGDGNCFFRAVMDQVRLQKHPFLARITPYKQPHDALRKYLQGEAFRDGAWAAWPDIEAAAKKLQAIIAIVDSRHSDLGFRCYYPGPDKALKETYIPEEVPSHFRIIRLLYTGNHYDSVISHPALKAGVLREAFNMHSPQHFPHSALLLHNIHRQQRQPQQEALSRSVSF